MVLIAYPSPLGNSTTFTKLMWEDAGSPQAVELGEGWTSFRDATLGSAFANTNIISIEIPASISSLEVNSFYHATSLTTVTFATRTAALVIGNQAFTGATALVTIEIPAFVTSIGNNAFKDATGLTTITFAAGSVLGTIGVEAFENTAIASIIIPASVTYLGANAFKDATSLTTVTFIESTVSATGITIDVAAFANNTAIASVFIKDGQLINTIPTTNLPTTGAFFGSATTTVIRSYEIAGSGVFNTINYTNAFSPPYTVLTNSDATGWTSIGDNAFAWTAITSIAIPASVMSIGNNAFNDCASLTTVTFAANSVLDSIGNSAFFYTALTSIIIPASVTEIGNSAFYLAASLASVTIAGSGLLTIGNSVFRSTALTSIVIPASVTEIGYNAFYACTSLASVTFIESTNSATGITIGTDAFHTTIALASVFIKSDQDIKNSSGTVITTDIGTTGSFFGSPGGTVIRLCWSKSDLVSAVGLWASDNSNAVATHGTIDTWDLGSVTDMSGLFENNTTFNEDISGWDMSNVTNRANMFKGATSMHITFTNS
jgi:hypothetical protein